MKQLQYGCQQKLINDFIMILLCFQHFQFYSTHLGIVSKVIGINKEKEMSNIKRNTQVVFDMKEQICLPNIKC